eukprot:8502242-Pyramimonas_sp.AAC.1
MLAEIGNKERIPEYIRRVKDPKDNFRLMGFGHRVYKAYDPRAKIMRNITHQVSERARLLLCHASGSPWRLGLYARIEARTRRAAVAWRVCLFVTTHHTDPHKSKKCVLPARKGGRRRARSWQQNITSALRNCSVLDHLKLHDPILELSMELERIALTDEYFVKRNLYPNIDFYSGICLRAMGVPVSMFTVLFAVARTVGWTSQVRTETPRCRKGSTRTLSP